MAAGYGRGFGEFGRQLPSLVSSLYAARFYGGAAEDTERRRLAEIAERQAEGNYARKGAQGLRRPSDAELGQRRTNTAGFSGVDEPTGEAELAARQADTDSGLASTADGAAALSPEVMAGLGTVGAAQNLALRVSNPQQQQEEEDYARILSKEPKDLTPEEEAKLYGRHRQTELEREERARRQPDVAHGVRIFGEKKRENDETLQALNSTYAKASATYAAILQSKDPTERARLSQQLAVDLGPQYASDNPMDGFQQLSEDRRYHKRLKTDIDRELGAYHKQAEQYNVPPKFGTQAEMEQFIDETQRYKGVKPLRRGRQPGLFGGRR